MPGFYPVTSIGDVEIGAVEVKDGATDNRAVVTAANTAAATTDKVLLVKPVRADGSVDPTFLRVVGTLTRPADTTTYAINDAMTDTGGAQMTMTGAARAANKGGYIVGATLCDSANVAVHASLEAWIYNTSVTADADNAAFTPTDAENLTLVGVVPFTLWYNGDETVGAGGNAVSIGTVLTPIPFNSVSGNLFVIFKVKNAYIPISGEVFTLNLEIEQR